MMMIVLLIRVSSVFHPWLMSSEGRGHAPAAYPDVSAGPLRHRIRDQPVDEPVARQLASEGARPVARAARYARPPWRAGRDDDAAEGAARPGLHGQRGAGPSHAFLQ